MCRKLIICILVIGLLSLLQSCCAIIGYNLGKSIDKKSKPEIYVSSTDSSLISSEKGKADTTQNPDIIYTTLFSVVGLAADLSLALYFTFLINPIQFNLKF